MTDHQPEVVATADLTPESPKPIHLSSPVLIPTLQDQADILSSMEPLSFTDAVGVAPSAVDVSQPSNGAAGSVPPAAPVNGSLAAADGSDGSHDMTGHHAGHEAQTAPDATGDHADEYAKAFDSPPPADQDAFHDDESKPADTSEAYDPAKALSALDGTSTTAPELSPAHAAASAEEAATSSVPEPVAAVVTSRSDPATQPAQIPVHESTVVSAAAPSAESAKPDDGIDIQALVDKITAASETIQTSPVAPEDGPGPEAPPNPQTSLPPKPPASQQPTPADLRAEELRRFQPNVPAAPNVPNVPATMSYSYPAPAAAPDATAAPYTAPPHIHANPAGSLPVAPSYGAPQMPAADASQRYDDFLKEERKYVSEAKWDRFPEGSRLFIGNLSSERVAKKEVFDIFSRYGRLAQISLKQAYGFVQYHTVAEGQAAMDNLQGIEIRGRKIHLEFSRTQKKDGDGEKRGNRGGRGGGAQADRDRDRFDARRRDGYRPRSPSPNRGHYRNDSYGRDRGHWEPHSDYSSSRRGRSRSPTGYGSGSSGYRHRSPSPYRRGPPASEAELDIPHRYGADVPDVQLLLLQEVNRDFVAWVQGAFLERGLKVDVMFLNPRFPRELVIQRQVVEGVYAISELDYRAQSVAKIPLQTFDRSAGRHNARFDQYQDLEPKIAAEIVARTKAQTQPQLHSPAGYGNGQFPPVSYPPAPQPHPHPHLHPHQHQAYPGQPLANINVGSLDNAALQKILSNMQGASQGGAPGPHLGGAAGVDVNAVLSALGANPGNGAPQQHQQQMGYAPNPSMPGAPGVSAADQAHVQNIMAQLSRYRH